MNAYEAALNVDDDTREAFNRWWDARFDDSTAGQCCDENECLIAFAAGRQSKGGAS